MDLTLQVELCCFDQACRVDLALKVEPLSSHKLGALKLTIGVLDLTIRIVRQPPVRLLGVRAGQSIECAAWCLALSAWCIPLGNA